MSDFNDLCDVFDNMGLKYHIEELENSREISIDEGDIPSWFDFDSNGIFKEFYVKE